MADSGQQSEWFRIKTGVKQDYRMSGVLFLLAIDWIMRTVLSDTPMGIRWKMVSKLEDLDFADDIALLSSTHEQIKQKSMNTAKKIGLNISKKKTKAMKINNKNQAAVIIDNEVIKSVDRFSYLGAVVSKTGRSMVDTFIFRCLRYILKIYWPYVVSNEEFLQRTNSIQLSREIQTRRWRWIGHLLRMEHESHCITALTWQPEGKRNRGRPKTTRRRIVEQERNQLGWQSWNETRRVAADRIKWIERVKAL